MDGFTFQTHSVYREKQTGALLLLVHHNPMALRSLLLNGKADGFDAAHPQTVGVDSIIALRKSGNFEELPPLPENEFAAILHELNKHVSSDDQPFVQALIDQLEKK